MPTQVSFGTLAYNRGASINAIDPKSATSETFTASGTNQTTAAAASAAQSVCRVATDVAVYVEIGTAPDATNDAGGRLMVMAGATEYFAVQQFDKVALVTA